jgi:nicotinamidase-related amidase
LHDAGALVAGAVLTMVGERQQSRYGYEATYFSSEFEAYHQTSPTGAITQSSMPEDPLERAQDDREIPKRAATCHAVLVVDVQEKFGASSGWHALSKAARDLLIATINGVSDSAAGSGMTVVYAHKDLGRLGATSTSRPRTKGTAGNNAVVIRSDTGLRMVSELSFPKRAPDAFSNSRLDGFLREKGIDHLFIVGVDGATSIERTARSALDRGYRVTFIQDGVFTTSENKWKRLVKFFESAGAFAITQEEFAEFCQRLRRSAAA